MLVAGRCYYQRIHGRKLIRTLILRRPVLLLPVAHSGMSMARERGCEWVRRIPAAVRKLTRIRGRQRMRSSDSDATATSGNATGLCSGRGRRNRTGRQANRNGTPAPAHAPAPPANAPAARSPLPHNTSTPAKAHVPNTK